MTTLLRRPVAAPPRTIAPPLVVPTIASIVAPAMPINTGPWARCQPQRRVACETAYTDCKLAFPVSDKDAICGEYAHTREHEESAGGATPLVRGKSG